jgi:tryptophanyl-tRNA synthetase
VPEHAELHLLMSMMTPQGWLERVPTYKDQQEKLSHKDLSTYGFLGYPLLMSADILIYRADKVPVGEDQLPHVEFTRELARRFNHMYGREPGFEEKAKEAIKKLGSKRARLYDEFRTRFQQNGDEEGLALGKALLEEAQSLSMGDRERLYGYLEGSGKMILVEPGALLTEASRCRPRRPEDVQVLRQHHLPARRGRLAHQEDPHHADRPGAGPPHRPGDPEKCPVWQFHVIYSDDSTRNWVTQGCKSAGIGCIECKQPVIDAVLKEQDAMRERAQPYLDDPTLVRASLPMAATRRASWPRKPCAKSATRWG